MLHALENESTHMPGMLLQQAEVLFGTCQGQVDPEERLFDPYVRKIASGPGARSRRHVAGLCFCYTSSLLELARLATSGLSLPLPIMSGRSIPRHLSLSIPRSLSSLFTTLILSS